ncbi:DNA-3-methyladenine glycosylase I [Alteromonas sp. a30]|uniref:DNA-3-methyladenine glycosylase I n=1 Tax=Alteromonas sp. a30 TaxID=2730917 RepID=UPI00228123B5|nr:DNA-3-methyladenine glycosylase I [Alteromonas sp. a30]MCY7295432.1 DNA-3-methyladenine glycosylase I [Alteromonas sp. a30]
MDLEQQQMRCDWASKDPAYLPYHDTIWGVPVYDNQALFAKLCLDGQQAGLSWLTILKRQKNYEMAFHQFDPYKIAQFTESNIEDLLQNSGIIRNRRKIESIIKNAKAFIQLAEEGIEFSDFIWSTVNYKTIVNHYENLADVPATSKESDMLAEKLKKAGFSFAGSTICYAFMQAVGLVNDHLTTCFRHQELKQV